MFQGGFNLLRCAHSPGAQTRASSRVTDARDIRSHLDFIFSTPMPATPLPSRSELDPDRMKNRVFRDYFTPAGGQRKKPRHLTKRARLKNHAFGTTHPPPPQ